MSWLARAWDAIKGASRWAWILLVAAVAAFAGLWRWERSKRRAEEIEHVRTKEELERALDAAQIERERATAEQLASTRLREASAERDRELERIREEHVEAMKELEATRKELEHATTEEDVLDLWRRTFGS